MKTKALLLSKTLLLSAALLLSGLSFAQSNYNAGVYSGTGGYYNVFMGPYAGRHTTSSFNSFLGSYAGSSNTVGGNNSFVGSFAGTNNTTGSNNSFLGTYAGINNNGGANSFLGSYAGYSNTVGGNNSFVGTSAGYSNTEGETNSFLGGMAGYYNSTGSDNNFLGYMAGYYNSTGSNNIFLGREAGYYNTTGYNNVSVGNFSGPSADNLSNATAIGYRARVTISNALVLGSINGINGATASTRVGIKTTAPGYDLHVNGSAAKPGGGSWTAPSDQRLKKDVRAFTDGLEVVKQIKPVWFRYNGEAGLPQEQQFVGIIAQEMQKIAPYTIGKFTYQDTTGKATDYLDYDANALTYMLVNAVKEQQKQLEEQQQLNQLKDARITALESKLAEVDVLKQELVALKALLLKQPTAATAEGEAAQLWQNEPNPTDGSTVIRFRIPQDATSAQLKLFSTSGQELQSFELSERGEGSLTISTGKLASGTYVYRLLVDGKGVDARKLVLTR